MRLPQAGVRAHGIDASADDHRGIEASGGKNGGNHRSGGGFAVHAGDGNAVLQAHQLGQHFSALDDRDVQVARRNDFGVVFGDGGAGDDDFCTGDVFGAMPFKRCGAQTARRSVTAEVLRSEPETLYPRLSRTSAMPLMPMPPMPTKWM